MISIERESYFGALVRENEEKSEDSLRTAWEMNDHTKKEIDTSYFRRTTMNI